MLTPALPSSDIFTFLFLPQKALEQWNGCDYVESIEGLHGPNVPGLGHVQQVQNVKDPSSALENLFCKQFPGPRAFHQLVSNAVQGYLM